MKIGLEIQPILKNKTGVGWYTKEILDNIDMDIFDMEGFGFNFMNRHDIQQNLNKLKFNYKINKLMPYGFYRRIWDYFPISFNKLFNTNAEIFHFFNYIVPPKIKGKVIVTVYDMVYKTFPNTMDRRNYKMLDKELRRSIERSDRIITISQNSKKEIIEYLHVSEDKIDIVYPAVDHDKYSKRFSDLEIEKTRSKYNLPSHYILYLGTLEPRKNIEKIIDSYAKLNDELKEEYHLVIAGKKGWMYDSVFERVKEYGLQHKVVFTGYVEEEDKPLIYKLSDLFIFPSLYEGFGMPVLEAMASGIPVITSNTSSLPEVVGEAGILVDPQNTNDITIAINDILCNSDLKKDMIKKGLCQSKKFSWEKSAYELLNIYREVGQYEKNFN